MPGPSVGDFALCPQAHRDGQWAVSVSVESEKLKARIYKSVLKETFLFAFSSLLSRV